MNDLIFDSSRQRLFVRRRFQNGTIKKEERFAMLFQQERKKKRCASSQKLI